MTAKKFSKKISGSCVTIEPLGIKPYIPNTTGAGKSIKNDLGGLEQSNNFSLTLKNPKQSVKRGK